MLYTDFPDFTLPWSFLDFGIFHAIIFIEDSGKTSYRWLWNSRLVRCQPIVEPDRGLCGYHKPNRAGETSLKENAKSNRGDLLMGHPYFLAGYLVFVRNGKIPISFSSFSLSSVIFPEESMARWFAIHVFIEVPLSMFISVSLCGSLWYLSTNCFIRL